MSIKKFFIDVYYINHWRQGYKLQLGIMRPENAPKYRQTETDRKRQKYKAKINLEIADRYFKDLNEIQEFINELNKI